MAAIYGAMTVAHDKCNTLAVNALAISQELQ